MRQMRIAIFGAAEKGRFSYPYICCHLTHLFQTFGIAPKDTAGLSHAIQHILRGGETLFFRVEEEGFSVKDYLTGLRYLEKQKMAQPIDALYLPGVGIEEILKKASALCKERGWLLVVEEKDLFDYFTR